MTDEQICDVCLKWSEGEADKCNDCVGTGGWTSIETILDPTKERHTYSNLIKSWEGQPGCGEL